MMDTKTENTKTHTGSEKLDFLLSLCFRTELKQLSTSITNSLLTKREQSLINLTHKLSNYIDRPKAEINIKKDCFNSVFVIGNYKHPVILEFLINKLSEFEPFEWGYINGWTLRHGDNYIGSWGWRKFLGHECWESYPYKYSNEALYHAGFNQSLHMLKKFGIIPQGAGSVNDYISRGIVDLKPHVNELLKHLKKVHSELY